MRESCTYGSVRGALSNERPYRDRSIGIGLVTVLAGASVLLSSDVGARPAGSSAVHSVPAASPVRPTGFLRGSWTPRNAGHFFHRRHFFRDRGFGNNLGFWGGSPWYDNNYGSGCYDCYSGYSGSPGYGTPYATPSPYTSPPSAYSGGPYPPAISTPDPKQVIYVLPYRPGCETKTETLPWRNGSEHSVRIVRC